MISNTKGSEEDSDLIGLRAVLLLSLEKRLDLPTGYIMSLRSEPDDWTFIVKLALLVEAALTEFLVLELDKPALFSSISTLPNSKRLELALALGALTKNDKEVLNVLAEVRNDYAHRIANLNRTLADYVGELKEARQNQIARHLLGEDGMKQFKGSSMATDKWLPDIFRNLLIDTVVLPLISLSHKHDIIKRDKERIAWKQASSPPKAVFQFEIESDNNDLLIGSSGSPETGLDLEPENGS